MSIINENIPKSHLITISNDDLKQIENQKKTCVFKITSGKMNGTGFFGLIEFPNKKMIRALFTCHHNLFPKNSKVMEKSFQYSIGMNDKFISMEIDDSRFVYKNEDFDIIIIEILERDKIPIDSYLLIDDYIYKDDNEFIKLLEIIKNNGMKIYLLHYLLSELLYDSTGLITKFDADKKYQFQHECSSEHGSSGGPLINLENYKVFGIHTGSQQKAKYNLGTCLRDVIKDFTQKYQENKRNPNYITKELFFQLKSELKERKEKLKSLLKKDKTIKEKYELNEGIDANEDFHSDIITIKYSIDKEKEIIKIFNQEFVQRNKNIKIIITGKTIDICDKIKIKDFAKNEKSLEIYLKDLNKIRSMYKIFAGCNTLISLPNIYRWDTTNVNDMSWAFADCTSLSGLSDISKWNTENVTDMGGMFKGCESLLSLPDISKWNTSKVINFGEMFSGCNRLMSLPEISNWNISRSINISKMFSECKSLPTIPDISKWDISNIEDMSYLFYRCENLLSLPDNLSKWNIINVNKINYLFGGLYRLKMIPDISNWDTSNVFDMQSLFINCRQIFSLPDISKWNTSNIRYMNAIFAGCRNLNNLPDISNWDTSKVVDMKYMFMGDYILVSLPDISKWNTSNVKRMNSMFENCKSLYSIPDISKWNISNVIDLRNMFLVCSSLQSLPDISKWNTQNVRFMTGMFGSCSSLKSLPIFDKWDISNLQDYRAMFIQHNPDLILPPKFRDNEFYYHHEIKDIFHLDDEL